MRYVVPFGRSHGATRRGLDPFTAMQREMENVLDAFARGLPAAPDVAENGFFAPAVEVKEDDKGLTIEADLPGVEPEDVSVELDDGVLTLKAERKEMKEVDDKDKESKVKYHLAERVYGTFLRRFNLPWEADEDKIEASFDKGVLKVFVPKKMEEKKARKIAVKAK